MTVDEASSSVGQAIVGAIASITEDGLITEEEVRSLRALLDELDGTGVAAVDYLFDAIDDVLSDGRYDLADAWEMRAAFERVLPKRLREPIFEEFDSAAGARRARQATGPQRAYLATLGITIDFDITLSDASRLIDRAHEENPLEPSNRQIMVLRFWDRLEVAARGRRGVSRWLTGWYRDPRKKRAWAQFKMEAGDDRSQADPARVPIGLGYQYLARIESQVSAALEDAMAAALAVEAEGDLEERGREMETSAVEAISVQLAVAGASE